MWGRAVSINIFFTSLSTLAFFHSNHWRYNSANRPATISPCVYPLTPLYFIGLPAIAPYPASHIDFSSIRPPCFPPHCPNALPTSSPFNSSTPGAFALTPEDEFPPPPPSSLLLLLASLAMPPCEKIPGWMEVFS